MDIKRPRQPRQPQQSPHPPVASPQQPIYPPAPRRKPFSRTTKITLWAIGAAITATIIIGSLHFFLAPRLASSPSFQALLPTGKSINKLGGWTRVSPADHDPAFSYDDTINDIAIKVSQQQLTNASQSVAEIAKAYNATDKITAQNTTVYIGTSFQGPQSVLFAKGDLLVMIGSQATISHDDWISYINSLE